MMHRLLQTIMKPESSLIVLLVVLMLVSSYYLASIDHEQRQLTPAKNIWILSFSQPKTQTLDFIIGNYTEISAFHWSIESASGQRLDVGDIDVPPGTEKIVPVEVALLQGKILVTVSHGSENKQVYKILPALQVGQ